ncbi:MAG: hypothetical protein IPG46_18230 [Actinobacteria bacterium]|nr:hypothetical protein [Actinomycetota bacterium]
MSDRRVVFVAAMRGESADPAIGSAGERSPGTLRGVGSPTPWTADMRLRPVTWRSTTWDGWSRCPTTRSVALQVVASLVRDGLVAVVDDGAGGAGGAVRAGSAAMVRLGGAPPAPRPG